MCPLRTHPPSTIRSPLISHEVRLVRHVPIDASSPPAPSTSSLPRRWRGQSNSVQSRTQSAGRLGGFNL